MHLLKARYEKALGAFDEAAEWATSARLKARDFWSEQNERFLQDLIEKSETNTDDDDMNP